MSDKRTIGIEIEFSGVRPLAVADIVKKHYGGQIKKLNTEEVEIETSEGVFKVETDSKFVKKMARSSKRKSEADKMDFDGFVKDFISPLSQRLVPTELVTPPLEYSQIRNVQELCLSLIKKGAEGTQKSFQYAFGLQLNPQVESENVDYLLRILQSFILLTPWLRDQIKVDFLRNVTFYVDDFPHEYCYHILHKGYRPNLESFIDDYIAYNPTRNRGLDMLPLFAYLQPERVKKVDDERIKARPTFHYRLPNCMLGMHSWSIMIEVSRWNLVEKLANSGSLLEIMKERYLELHEDRMIEKKSKWLLDIKNYVEFLRSQA